MYVSLSSLWFSASTCYCYRDRTVALRRAYGPRPCTCRCHRYRSRHQHVIVIVTSLSFSPWSLSGGGGSRQRLQSFDVATSVAVSWTNKFRLSHVCNRQCLGIPQGGNIASAIHIACRAPFVRSRCMMKVAVERLTANSTRTRNFKPTTALGRHGCGIIYHTWETPTTINTIRPPI